jgi:hypothetical protein
MFAPDYLTARNHFRAALRAVEPAEMESIPFPGVGPQREDLTLDMARLGPRNARKLVVVSSGLHGVEGFLGSAIQCFCFQIDLPPDTALLLLHALNPFGFAHLRRTDADNIDLNRNFLRPGQRYAGSHTLYAHLDVLLNPASPPPLLDPFVFRAYGQLLRYGQRALMQAIAQGQYDYPHGLFFGGQRPAHTHLVLAAHLHRWLEPAQRILHLDLHTGLGSRRGALLLDPLLTPPKVAWLRRWFPRVQEPQQAAYTTQGGFDAWCMTQYAALNYTAVCAEFGTYSPLRVIGALRAENRAHFHARPGSLAYRWAKQRLRHALTPTSPRWQRRTLAIGLEWVQQAALALTDPE